MSHAAITALFVILLGWAMPGTLASQAPVAIVGATLLDGTGGAPVPDAVVVARHGDIVCAGTLRKADLSPPRARFATTSGLGRRSGNPMSGFTYLHRTEAVTHGGAPWPKPRPSRSPAAGSSARKAPPAPAASRPTPSPPRPSSGWNNPTHPDRLDDGRSAALSHRFLALARARLFTEQSGLR